MTRHTFLDAWAAPPLVASCAHAEATPATPRERWISVANTLLTAPAESYAFDWGEGTLMCGMTQTHERTQANKYADFVARWADSHLSKGIARLLRNEPGASRSPEGALGHWVGNYQLWVDTLAMACPLLSRLSRAENKPAYIDDAVNQLLVAARHMREPRTGLVHHMWDWQYDDPASPAECSATTMICYGLLKLARQGILPVKYRQAALRAWRTANERWVDPGKVVGVSEGTGPYTRDRYLDRKMGTYTWGTGSYLMAGAEVDRLHGAAAS